MKILINWKKVGKKKVAYPIRRRVVHTHSVAFKRVSSRSFSATNFIIHLLQSKELTTRALLAPPSILQPYASSIFPMVFNYHHDSRLGLAFQFIIHLCFCLYQNQFQFSSTRFCQNQYHCSRPSPPSSICLGFPIHARIQTRVLPSGLSRWTRGNLSSKSALHWPNTLA